MSQPKTTPLVPDHQPVVRVSRAPVVYLPAPAPPQVVKVIVKGPSAEKPLRAGWSLVLLASFMFGGLAWAFGAEGFLAPFALLSYAPGLFGPLFWIFAGLILLMGAVAMVRGSVFRALLLYVGCPIMILLSGVAGSALYRLRAPKTKVLDQTSGQPTAPNHESALPKKELPPDDSDILLTNKEGKEISAKILEYTGDRAKISVQGKEYNIKTSTLSADSQLKLKMHFPGKK
jgi:hypothetical protein